MRPDSRCPWRPASSLRQADGAVLVRVGDTTILSTVVTSKPREGIDFFPLTVDVEERMYAAGQDPRRRLPS